MELQNLCRCCLTRGTHHKDFNSIHMWLNQEEVYSEMLSACYNINLSKTDTVSRICDVCVKLLRDSLAFKQQVLRSELKFLKCIKDLQNEPKVQTPKLELEIKDEILNDSKKDVPKDTAPGLNVRKIKEELKNIDKKLSAKKGNRNVKSKARSKPIDPRNFPELTIKSKPATMVVRGLEWLKVPAPDVTVSKVGKASPSPPKAEVKRHPRHLPINPALDVKGRRKRVGKKRVYTTHTSKLRHNVCTVLQNSNATPFKGKNLLGFICIYCDSTFPDPADLRTHTREDHRSNQLDLTFDPRSVIRFDVTDLTCTCQVKFESLTELLDHLVEEHDLTIYTDIKDPILPFKLKKGDIFECALCSAKYETFKMLSQHMNSHYGHFSCAKCGSTYATKRSYSVHMRTHQDGNFKCDYCDKVFPSKIKQRYHQRLTHFGERRISNCPLCDEPFRTYYQRNRHLMKVHNSEYPYKCNVCDKAFALKTLLMYHIKKQHLMEKNFQCDICENKFFSKRCLREHMISHIGKRVHTCAVCNKSYARKTTLREHARTHADDRRFRCGLCDAAFVQKCSLRGHMRTVHGVNVAASEISVEC